MVVFGINIAKQKICQNISSKKLETGVEDVEWEYGLKITLHAKWLRKLCKKKMDGDILFIL